MFLILSYIYLFENNSISKLYPILKIISVILVVIIAIAFHQEKLSISETFGIIFALIALYLLS